MAVSSRPDLVGVLLAGGASRRMGRDKALLGPPDRPLAARIAAVLTEVCGGGVVTVGGDGERLRRLGLDWMPDDHPDSGPLGGISTVARSHPGSDLVVAACDLPWIDARTVDQVASALDGGGPGGVFVDRDARAQWSLVSICGSLATRVVARFDAGERSVWAVLEGAVVALQPTDPQRIADADRPEDLPPELRP